MSPTREVEPGQPEDDRFSPRLDDVDGQVSPSSLCSAALRYVTIDRWACRSVSTQTDVDRGTEAVEVCVPPRVCVPDPCVDVVRARTPDRDMGRELSCAPPLVPYSPSTPPRHRDDYSVISDEPLPEDRRRGASWEHFRVSSEERRRRNRNKRRSRRRRNAERRRDAAREDARPPAASPLTPPPLSQPRPRPQVTSRPQSPPRSCDYRVRNAAAPTPLLSAEEIAQIRLLLRRDAIGDCDARRGGQRERFNPPRFQRGHLSGNEENVPAIRRPRRRRRGGNNVTPPPKVRPPVQCPPVEVPPPPPSFPPQPLPPPAPPAMPRVAWPPHARGVDGGARVDTGGPNALPPPHPGAAPNRPAPVCRALDDPAPPAQQCRALDAPVSPSLPRVVRSLNPAAPPRRTGAFRVRPDARETASRLPDDLLNAVAAQVDAPSVQTPATLQQQAWLIQIGLAGESTDGIFRVVRSMRDAARAASGITSPLSRGAASHRQRRQDPPLTAAELQALYRERKGKAFKRVCGGNDADRCRIPLPQVKAFFSRERPRYDEALAAPSVVPPFERSGREEEEASMLMRPITAGEVSRRLRRTLNTAPGPDGVPYSAWKQLDPDCRVLAAVYDFCFRAGRVPKEWKESHTILLHKGGDEDEIGNWRPIALSPTILKVYTGVLADRIAAWAVRGRRMSFPAQKGFLPATEGCMEHNFVLQAALDHTRSARREIAVAWLDLTDAFGSVPHAHIARMLRAMGMPERMVGAIAEMYEGSTTNIITASGSTGEIPVKCGVRQGDPLSPLLFNLALEPVIRAVLARRAISAFKMGSTSVCVLAYADDLVLVAKDAGMLRGLLHVAGAAASWCGLRFNARKCGSLHMDFRSDTQREERGVRPTIFRVQGEDMRALARGEAYKYLGSPVGHGVDAVPHGVLNNIHEDLRRLDESELAPWQKIDAVHTFLTPRLDYTLRITPVPKAAIARVDADVHRSVKKWMYLPTRASREIVAMPRGRGGGGHVPLAVRKDVFAVVHAFRMLTCPDSSVSNVAWHTLRDVVERRVGRTGNRGAIGRGALCSYLNGADDDTIGTGTNAAASVWSRTRRATKELTNIVPVTWRWSDARRELAVSLAFASPHGREVVVPAPARRRLFSYLIRAVGEAFRRRLVAKPDQGKVMEATSLCPDSNHFVGAGRMIRFCDWRFIHRARLNVLPLNAARRGAARGDTRCRVCGQADETLPHVICHCLAHSDGWRRRHDAIVEILRAALPSSWRVRLDRRVPGDESLLRPDVVAWDEGPDREVIVVDVVVPFDNRSAALAAAREKKIEKYDALVERMRVRSQYRVPHSLEALVVGALGS
ncbi:uncharacterized protein LOC124159735 [Ischnura elegans]|uniref:uncharacterized protein LOC124159735 n=1 Tax=Ischnura elegans TaxID=197161 RepID=UPI001ED8AA85|nr:uncharacterized protein LOC124159735 [Ischnura elegans]